MTNDDKSNGFSRHNRLRSAAAYGRVFEKATRSRDKIFTVLCRRNESGTARLGMAISKRNCRLASTRNRIKRTIRESFRQHAALLSGLDIVVLNLPAAALAAPGTLRNSLDSHWPRCAKAKQHRQMQES